MYWKILTALLLIGSISLAGSKKSVKDEPPKTGTPEEFLVKMIIETKKQQLEYEKFKLIYCDESLFEYLQEKTIKRSYVNILDLNTEKRFMYRATQKDNGVTQIKIYSEKISDGNGISTSFYVKKIDGKYKWSGS